VKERKVRGLVEDVGGGAVGRELVNNLCRNQRSVVVGRARLEGEGDAFVGLPPLLGCCHGAVVSPFD